jgi:hypothetical protein
VEVDRDGYRLRIGETSGGRAAGSCGVLWDCLCESPVVSSTCWALERGYFTDAGCAEVLAGYDCSAVGRPGGCDDYECGSACAARRYSSGDCIDGLCICGDGWD